MRTDDLDYDLPEDLIATQPVSPRDSARMLVISRSDPNLFGHRRVHDLPDYLNADDVLIFNTTSVVPARFLARRADSGGRVEGLFLDEPGPGEAARWLVMLKSNSKLRPGQMLAMLGEDDRPVGEELELIEKHAEQWVVRCASGRPAVEVLDAVGLTPIPPYILRARRDKHAEVADRDDRSWYQTVFADRAARQSVAAPTAGLHFTTDLLKKIHDKGVKRADITLHVGPGTFKPIAVDEVERHPMHWERYEVSAATLDLLADRASAPPATARNGRLFAVGTTTVRTLESLAKPLPSRQTHGRSQIAGQTDLLITPPYAFNLVEALLTNFHLPRSTLLALVAAMVGLDRLMDVYRLAVAERYRFYSYGDAMLILP